MGRKTMYTVLSHLLYIGKICSGKYVYQSSYLLIVYLTWNYLAQILYNPEIID